MAVNKALEKTKLQIVVVIGEAEDGTEKLQTINFSQLDKAVTDEVAQTVGAAIGTLQTHKVACVKRVDQSILNA